MYLHLIFMAVCLCFIIEENREKYNENLSRKKGFAGENVTVQPCIFLPDYGGQEASGVCPMKIQTGKLL